MMNANLPLDINTIINNDNNIVEVPQFINMEISIFSKEIIKFLKNKIVRYFF